MMKSSYDTPDKLNSVFKRDSVRYFLVIFLVVSAFAIRMHNISSPPLDYSPVRQYQAAHNARGYYFENNDEIPQWRKEIAKINMKRMGFVLEPRILEYAAVAGYRIAGSEQLWIPRALSALFWVTGGFFLYLIARQIYSYEEALLSTAFYLFLPFGISASRSFQPDPLMTMMMIFSVYMVIRYCNTRTWASLIAAAVVAALAMLVKPYCLFLIYGALISIFIYREGIKKTVFSPHILIFIFISFLPAAIYYLMGILYNVGFLQELAKGSFMPHLVLRPYFWGDWLEKIGHVIGYIPFICAAIGLFMAPKGLPRTLLAGLWIGYIVFGLVFTYHIHTHGYYHLQFVPVVALSIAPVASSIFRGLSRLSFFKKTVIISSPVLFMVLFAAWLGVSGIDIKSHKDKIKSIGAVFGINPELYKFVAGEFSNEVKVAEEIGELVGHGSNTVFLTPFYGRYIAYHGEFAGLPWPIAFSLQERSERGLKPLSKDELFNKDYLTIRTHGEYVKYRPDFFIVMAFDELEKQRDLKDFLESNYPVLAQNSQFMIYDMREMSGEKGYK